MSIAFDRPGGTRRIAVVPAYNEEPTVAQVLEKLSYLVDELVVVDDGSTDRTRAEIETWLPGHDHVRLLSFDENQGMSAAYHLAFTDLRRRMRSGELSADDLVFTVDADGQHDLDVIDDLHRRSVPQRHADGRRVHRPRRHPDGSFPGDRPPATGQGRAQPATAAGDHRSRNGGGGGNGSPRASSVSAPVEVAGQSEQFVESD